MQRRNDNNIIAANRIVNPLFQVKIWFQNRRMKWKRSKKAQQEAKICSRDDGAALEKRSSNVNHNNMTRTCGNSDSQNDTCRSPGDVNIDCPASTVVATAATTTAVQTLQSHHTSAAAQLNRGYHHTINNNISVRSHDQDGNCESLYRPYVS